jgi:hypothetical protein
VTVFSKVVLGLQDALYYSFSLDWSSFIVPSQLLLILNSLLSLILQLSFGVRTLCSYHSPIGGYVRYQIQLGGTRYKISLFSTGILRYTVPVHFHTCYIMIGHNK